MSGLDRDHPERIHELVLEGGVPVTCYCPIDADHNMADLGRLPDLALVAPGVVPPQTIDRDALVTLLLDAVRGTTVPAVPLADRILALVRPAEGAMHEFCVQYRCPPGMTDWHEFSGSRRGAQRWAQVELDNLRSQEFDPTVEYRVAVRSVTEWEAVS